MGPKGSTPSQKPSAASLSLEMAALVACSALVTSFVAPAAPRASSRSSVSMYYGTGTYQTPFTFEGGDLRRRRTLSRQAASLSLNLCPGAATIGNSRVADQRVYVGYTRRRKSATGACGPSREAHASDRSDSRRDWLLRVSRGTCLSACSRSASESHADHDCCKDVQALFLIITLTNTFSHPESGLPKCVGGGGGARAVASSMPTTNWNCWGVRDFETIIRPRPKGTWVNF